MAAPAGFQAKFHDTITAIGRTGWDTCAGSDNPFIGYDFLSCLEQSGCAAADSGWQPYHCAIYEDEKASAPTALMPLYLKNHSFGEYVFDHAWANAFEHAGGRYYPKLQSSVPFSPVTGSRLLTDVGEPERAALQRALLTAAKQLTDRLGLSSLHLTFLPEDEAELAALEGYLLRNDQQFHWRNQNYQDFDDFLGALSSRKRKQIKKERRTARDSGVHIETLTGGDITEDHWDHFFACYMDTGARKWGQPYLNREFFSMIGERLADRIALVVCSRGDRIVASALNFIGGDTLYGRYWGCLEDYPCLHFEACYYQAIDFAITHKLAFVEAGAQGPHKLARGYEPVKTYSAHYLPDPGFRRAVDQYLKVERREIDAEINYLGERSPFRKG